MQQHQGYKTNYEIIVDLAVNYAKVLSSRESIKNGPAPLQLLYAEMAGRKEIKSLRELDLETRTRYWREASGVEAPQFKKIWIAQALYMFDLIKEET